MPLSRVAATLLVAPTLAGCTRHDGPPLPLTVEWGGCAAVLAGASGTLACELPETRALRLWVHTPAGARVTVTAGERDQEVTPSPAPAPVAEGSLLHAVIPAGARVLHVTAERAGARGRFTLSLRDPAPIPVVARARSLRGDGKLDEAEVLLREVVDDLPDGARAQVMSLLARLAHAHGHIDKSMAILHRTIDLHHAAGRVSDENDDAVMLAYVAIYHLRRFDLAREVLTRQARIAAGHAEGLAHGVYTRGLLARETGDLRSALTLLDEAADRARRLGMDGLERFARQALARCLEQMGRYDDARARLAALRDALPADADDCQRAHLLNNLGWMTLLAREARHAHAHAHAPASAGDPAPLLEEALRHFETGCRSVSEQVNVRINLALGALQDGDAAAARRHLDAARALQPEPDSRLAVWWLDVGGRIALLGDRPAEALDLYARLDAIAASAVLPEARWRAAVGRGRALDALGRIDESAAAYAAAEQHLDGESLRVPVGEGRDLFLGDREQSARLLVDALLRRDRAAGALQAARHARARVLAASRRADRIASLGAAERARWDLAIAAYRRERAAVDAAAAGDWRLRADRLAALREERRARERALAATLDEALSILAEAGAAASAATPTPPRDDEAILMWYPVRDGWAGLLARDDRVTARRFAPWTGDGEPAADAAAAAAWLAAFADEVDQAGRLRILPYGPLRSIDFHALPHRGAPLVERLPVAYGLDATHGPPGADPAAGGAALIIADPRRDLPAARREADAVATALREAGRFSVQLLAGDAADGAAVRAALQHVRLLHYAGHGVFAGPAGWEGELLLAGGDRLTVGDVLSLPRVPAEVVLSACETARTAAAAPVETLGLAQAFVAAGAGAVVAATRPVGDALAARVSAAVHTHAGRLGRLDAAAAVRAAQIAVLQRRSGMGEDWAAFRALVP